MKKSVFFWTLVLTASITAMAYICMHYGQITEFAKSTIVYSEFPQLFFAGIFCVPMALFLGSIAQLFDLPNTYELNALRDFANFFALCSLVGILLFLIILPIFQI